MQIHNLIGKWNVVECYIISDDQCNVYSEFEQGRFVWNFQRGGILEEKFSDMVSVTKYYYDADDMLTIERVSYLEDGLMDMYDEDFFA